MTLEPSIASGIALVRFKHIPYHLGAYHQTVRKWHEVDQLDGRFLSYVGY